MIQGSFSRFEEFDEVRVEYYNDESIVVIISNHNKPKHIDAYVGFIHDYFRKQPAGKRLFLCFDISQSGYNMYGVKRFEDLHKLLGKNMYGRIAVVIKKDIIGQTMQVFANLNLTKTAHERQFFYERELAIEWLREGLQDSLTDG